MVIPLALFVPGELIALIVAGKLGEALRAGHELKARALQQEDPAQMAAAKVTLAAVHSYVGAFEMARQLALDARESYRSQGNQDGEVLAGACLALALTALSVSDASFSILDVALAQARLGWDKDRLARMLCLGAGVWLLINDERSLDEAWQLAQEALDLSRIQRASWGCMTALALLSNIHLERGERAQALVKSYRAVLQLEADGHAEGDELLIWFAQAKALQCQGDGQALSYWQLTRRILAQRACSLADRDLRRSYLRHVSLHRSICQR